MLRNLALGLAGAMTLVAVPAAAQSANPAPFSGLYIGGSIGGALQSSDGNSSILFDRDRDGSFGDVVTTATGADAFSPGFCKGAARGPTPDTGCRTDKDGIEYMARVGFDKQIGNFVVGVVGDFGKADINDSVSAYSTTPATYTMTRNLRYNGGVRLRAGYVPGDDTMFYATGGGAYGRVRNSFATTNAANSFATNGASDAWGYSAGGGIEHLFGKHLSIGLEYLYTDLKDKDARVAVGPGTAPATNPFLLAGAGTDFRRSDKDFRYHSLRATAGFRF